MRPMFFMVSSGVDPLIPWMLSIMIKDFARLFALHIASTAASPFITQPWFPPSQIIPVIELAMLLITAWMRSYRFAALSKNAGPQAAPVPAAMAHPQNADSLPEYSLMYMQIRQLSAVARNSSSLLQCLT